jgi:hypothetical protein
MNEPSVLDYLKSIFKSRDAFRNFVKAVFEHRDTTQLIEADVPASQPVMVVERVPAFEARTFPWFTLAVLLLALGGQRMFEPPQQLYSVGIVLYTFALGMALLAFRRGEWSLTPLPADETRTDSFSIRIVPFVLSLILGAATFLMMKGNLFTATNLTLWAATIFFHLLAFWVPGPRRPIRLPALPRWNLIDFLTRDEWTIHIGGPRREHDFRITRWALLVFIAVAATIFFRTYRLDTVAPEMTSDHAEKLMDVYDITQGRYSIYFPRNTGREPLYIYLCALVSQWFGVSFLTLKIVAVIGGLLTLPYIYLLGRELGSARLGLVAAAFAGIAYWPTVIERFGLRISFYPLFAAATLYYFIRGLRRQHRNDFLLAGVALGLGLNGYTPFRIMPFVLVALLIVYFLHQKDRQVRKQVLVWFALLAFTSWIFFIPMARFAVERPDIFGERAFSRVGTTERPFPAPLWQLLLLNLWTALKEFNWYNGDIWVHSIPYRPALDVVSGALFLVGVTLVLVRYLRNRHWKDIMLLLAVPLLQMPSILSLAYPEENPSLNRTGGALVPVFLLVGFGLDSLLNSFMRRKQAVDSTVEVVASTVYPARSVFAGVVLLGLFVASFSQNYDLIFNQYYRQYSRGAWNSAEMGAVMRGFIDKGGPVDNVWIVPYAFWVDTRLPPFWAGVPGRDIAIAPDNIDDTREIPGPKLFMFQLQDEATRQLLEELYPQGVLTVLESAEPDHNFYVFRVPAQ